MDESSMHAGPDFDFPCFPMFVSLCGRRCVVIGGGVIGMRRVETLLGYGALVTLVSPDLSKEIAHPRLEVVRRRYADGDLDGAFLAVAATDDRDANRRVGEEAARRGILASVADCNAECTFKFPGTAVSPRLSMGVITRNGDHGLAKSMARRLREEFGDV